MSKISPQTIADLDNGETPDKNRNDVREITHLGYKILFGDNAFSNETMILNHPHKDCLWFHATFSKGAHVILCKDGKPEPTESIVRRAAGIALDHSKSYFREVAFAPLKDVYKPDGAKVGVFRTWRTEKIVL